MQVVGKLGRIGGLVVGFLATGCRHSADTRLEAEWWRLEADRVSLEAEVRLAGMRLADLEESGAGWTAMETRLSGLRHTRSGLESRLAELQDSCGRMAEAVVSSRRDALEQRRLAWSGRTLATLQALDGRLFEEVHVTRVTPIGVEFRHRTGLARLTSEQLGMLQCDRFGIDPEQSLDLAAREREIQRLARESWSAPADAAEPEDPAPVVAAYRPEPTVPTAAAARPNPLSESPRRFGGVSQRVRSHRTRYYHVWYSPRSSCRTPASRPAWNVQQPSCRMSGTPAPRYVPYSQP